MKGKKWIPENKYKRQKTKLKKQKINTVFNYSNVQITEPMINVLNRGLNFCVLPPKLDITQTLADLKKFNRTSVWKEYWFGVEKEDRKTPIFKKVKNNMPRKHTTPIGLKNYVAAIKSEIMDPNNRIKVNLNLSTEENKAISELIKLQKDKQIVVKPCDKGAGIMILNFNDYIQACSNHLNSELIVSGGNVLKYYSPVDEVTFEKAKQVIKMVIEEGFDNEWLSGEEFEAMDPVDKHPGKFYCTFKVHKKHNEGSVPPERPIISGSGSITENISLFVDHHIKNIATQHSSYLQDTPDFLRHIDTVNQGDPLPENALLVTMDVSALFTNISHIEGLQCTREALNERENMEIPTEFIVRLLELTLEYNIFEFSEQLFRQIIGAAMGSRSSPSYADIFMARRIDCQIKKLIQIFETNADLTLKFFKRFLDDLFFIFTGSTQILHTFFNEVNNIHPSIKLTMTHTTLKNEQHSCECPQKHSISFLDTCLSIKDGKINIDLYRKPTDRNQYLLPSSCHPPHCVKNIPYSLAMRIVRICTDSEQRDQRLCELRDLLLERNYSVGIINSAIEKARAIPRNVALKHVARTTSDTRPNFVVSFDQRLPDLPSIINKHWRSMTSMDPYLKEVFMSPPRISFRRQKNIRDLLVRAKVSSSTGRHKKRNIQGMRKCNKPCSICPYIKEGKVIKGDDFLWNIRKGVNCNSSNVVYMIECNKEKCKLRYIGECEKLRKRTLDHLGYIRNKHISKATGHHFNLPGHSSSNLTVKVIEKVKKKDIYYRKEREHYLIKKFNTYNKGMNRLP